MSCDQTNSTHPLASTMTEEALEKAEIRLAYQSIDEQVKDVTRKIEADAPLSTEEEIFTKGHSARGRGFGRALSLCD